MPHSPRLRPNRHCPSGKIYIPHLFNHFKFCDPVFPLSGLYPAIRMATQKQIEANRRNAQSSTGPKTEEGKSKSKFNALKHGMTAEVAVLPHEDKHSYEDLRQAAIESYGPPTEPSSCSSSLSL